VGLIPFATVSASKWLPSDIYLISCVSWTIVSYVRLSYITLKSNLLLLLLFIVCFTRVLRAFGVNSAIAEFKGLLTNLFDVMCKLLTVDSDGIARTQVGVCVCKYFNHRLR